MGFLDKAKKQLTDAVDKHGDKIGDGLDKVAAEAAALERENSLSFRLATVFGMSPRPRIDLLVNDFVHRAVTDRTVVLFEGHFKRNYIHIRDVAQAFMHCIDNFESMKGESS